MNYTHDSSSAPEPNAAGGLVEIPVPVIAGDPQDDDAAYLDEMLDETNGADVRTIPGLAVGDEWAHMQPEPLPAITTIQSGRWVGVDNTFPPIQLLPADPGRLELFIRIEGALADNLAIGSSRSDVARQGSNTAYWNNTDAFYSVCHTGPVWLGFGGLSTARNVSWWAVTATVPKDRKDV